MLKRKISILSCIILFSASSFIPALFAAKDVNKEIGLLNKITLTREENILEVDIIFGPYTSHSHFELSDPNRIVLDLKNIEDILSDRHFEVNDFGIQTIRAGMFKTDIARLVFDLKDKLSKTYSLLLELLEEGFSKAHNINCGKTFPHVGRSCFPPFSSTYSISPG